MLLLHGPQSSSAPRALARWLLAAALVPAAILPSAAQELVISEFLAINDGTLADEDGDPSDWLEIHNLGPASAELDGWSLTDDRARLSKWRFPPRQLASGAFLVVFASGKDRASPGGELHTSFRLSGDGEYLALVRPDGSIAHEYAPAYPRQRQDISFGIARGVESTFFIAAGAAAKVVVPSGGALGLTWTHPGFDDSSWQLASTGLGYDAGAPVSSPEEAVNVALGRMATQSSTGFGFGPALAVDGNLGNFTHTAAGQNLPATWQVDLGGVFAIESIVLHNRSSCCGSRLRDITVSILDASGQEVLYQSELLNPENVLGGRTTSGPARLVVDLIDAPGGAVEGRFVRVVRTPDPDLSGTGGAGNADEPDVLSLAEVEVFERPQVGFHRFIQTDIESAMRGTGASAYIRLPFELEAPPAFDRLVLRMMYDAGFAAYLNGREVARRNAPPALDWRSAATAERPKAEAIIFEEIDISAHLDALAPGRNLLAIHGLNSSAADEDFLILPELAGEVLLESALRYFRRPTPGAANDPAGVAGFVADTKFSRDRGFYDGPFEVEITSATPGAEIRYTLDGSDPGPTSGLRYGGPIRIAATTVLRARAFKPGLEPTDTDTHTYFFLEDVIRQDRAAVLAAGFPASWGGTSPDYGMDFRVIGQGGSDAFGGKYAATIRDDLLDLPSLSLVLSVADMFGPNGIYTNSTARGAAWERPVSAELIDPGGSKGFQVNAGLRIHGGAFRSHGLTKKHSLRLLFKKIYGPGKLQHRLFGRRAADRFDTLVLRANSNDGWQWAAAGAKPLYIRDSFGRQTILDMGGVASHEVFVHLYLNGIYWGLYDVVERPDASFSASYHGGERESWDAISNGAASSGSLEAWNGMLGIARGGLSGNTAYRLLQGLGADWAPDPALASHLDVPNLIDYMIVNLYAGNTDWPNKNYWIGRDRAAGGTGFKFYMWDSEWSLGLRSELGTDQTGVSSGVAEPYLHCRANAEFRLLFADHVHRHFFNGGALHVDPSRPEWDPEHPKRNVPAARLEKLARRIERALVAESARWGDQHAGVPYTRDEHWRVELQSLLAGYFPRRSAVVLQQFRGAGLYPAVEAPVFSRHGGIVEPDFRLAVSAPAGTVLYTLDGTDPRLPGGAVAPRALETGSSELLLLEAGAPARAFVPAGGSLGLDWTARDFDDSGWLEGTTGVGFEAGTGYESLIGLDLRDLAYQVNATVYVRIALEVPDPGGLSILTLRMKYDDGFIAYLNGRRIAAANAPAEPRWDSAATTNNPDSRAVVFESFDITPAIGWLEPGRNLLAIHGLNLSPGNGDLLILPEIAGTALDGGGIRLRLPALVRARALAGGVWSALNEAWFYGDIPLRISEIHYNPGPAPPGSPYGRQDFEFIELINTGATALDLAGIRLAGGIDFDFTEGALARLRPGEVALVVKSLEAFASRYPIAFLNIAGEYEGNLSNAGEDLKLIGPAGEPILDFEFRDDWYPSTDGGGHSLLIVDPRGPAARWGERDGWRPSDAPGGSPGIVESRPPDLAPGGNVRLRRLGGRVGARSGERETGLRGRLDLEAQAQPRSREPGASFVQLLAERRECVGSVRRAERLQRDA